MVRGICGIDASLKTCLSSIKLHVANVAKPLASAVKVAEAGSVIIIHPDANMCFIQNIDTGEPLQLRKDKGTTSSTSSSKTQGNKAK